MAVNVNVSPNVYKAVKDAINDFTITGKPNINRSELAKIEKEIAKDGKVDGGEKALLEALRSGAAFTISSGGDSTTITPSEYDFPSSDSVSKVEEGRVIQTGITNTGKTRLVNVPDSVPQQVKGSQTNISNSKTFGSQAEAHNAFAKAAGKLANIDGFRATADSASLPGTKSATNAEFKLLDASGNAITPPREPRIGDRIKIDVPGLPPSLGGRFDWVEVTAVEKTGDANSQSESLSVTVTPTRDPGKPPGSPIAHFYGAGTTNTFVVERKGNTVTAGVYGRNETANTEGGLTDNARNRAVAKGALNGASDFQWDHLTNGVLQD